MATSAAAQATVFALRREIARIEGTLAERLEEGRDGVADAPAGRDVRPRASGRVATGIGPLDRALGGGLPATGLIETHAAAARDAGSATGLTLALLRLMEDGRRVTRPFLWIATRDVFHEAGRPYAPGLLSRFGLDPDRLIVAEAGRIEEVLWIAEEAVAASIFSAVKLEVRGNHAKLDLTATRRLHRRALAAGHPLFLVRQAAEAEPTAAPVRLRVAAAPAGLRTIGPAALSGSIGPPGFRVGLSKSQTALSADLILEWRNDRFHERPDTAADARSVVPLSAHGTDPAAAAGAVVAFPGERRDAASGPEPSRGERAAHRSA